jgi:hypothetical protein
MPLQSSTSRDTLPVQIRWKKWTPWFVSHPDRLALLIVLLGFSLRAWMAHATFFNADEAWHYTTAIQGSLRQAWQASLTLYHPPLLIFVLYFWRKIVTSDLMLRLPCVISGTVFCWFFYKWMKVIFGYQAAIVGVLFMALLPTMIGVSADLRQYPLILMWLAASAYFLEDALQKNSWPRMLASGICLLLAMLSHYSGFLAAAALGIYVIGSAVAGGVSTKLFIAWMPPQLAGLALAGFLYSVQITKLAAARGSESAKLMANWYLPQFYYHPGRDHLLPFLFKGTFGIFRFTFGWVVIGHIATLMFIGGLILLLRRRSRDAFLTALLLFAPFFVSWAAAALGLYPYGRTRHSIFLAMFGIAGMTVAIAEICKRRTVHKLAFASAIILLCHAVGAQPWLDMLPLADRRHELMDNAMKFIHDQVTAADVIYVDKATEYQIRRYLCGSQEIALDRSVGGFESFRCNGLRIVSSFPKDDAVLAATFPQKWKEMAHAFDLRPGGKVWVIEGGWITGFAEMLRSRYPEFSNLDIHHFGRYLEIFDIPVSADTRSADGKSRNSASF